jgi:hypothetical protein
MQIQTEEGTIDLDFDASKYKTKAGAAKGPLQGPVQFARAIGQNPDIEVQLYTPEQSKERGYTSGWQVQWEAGPYQWAIGASFQVANYKAGWFTEPYYSFDLCFTD